jgi:transcription antitermination factor NusG
MYPSETWYLVRTKSNREQSVRERLSRLIPEVFVPMLKLPQTRSRRANSIVPLFPQYVFARFSLSAHYFDICYMPDVAGFVCAGREPLSVSESIVDSVRSRCTNGVLQLSPRPFRRGQQVRVVGGPFSDFQAIFEGYLSGARRVAILIETIEGAGLRVVADASTIVGV